MTAVYYQHDAWCNGCSELFYSLTSISPLGTRLSTRGPPIIWVMSQRLQLPPGVARPQRPNTLLSHTIRTWRNMFTSYPHMDCSVVKKSWSRLCQIPVPNTIKMFLVLLLRTESDFWSSWVKKGHTWFSVKSVWSGVSSQTKLLEAGLQGSLGALHTCEIWDKNRCPAVGGGERSHLQGVPGNLTLLYQGGSSLMCLQGVKALCCKSLWIINMDILVVHEYSLNIE